MIASLKGTVIELTTGKAILDVGGVGYLIHVPTSMESSVAVGSIVQLHTHLAVREDSMTLYGFETVNDREVFEHLISVSGIGPRLGLAILSSYEADEVIGAIHGDKPEVFSSVSGIGKKNAQRIIIDLKNKLPALDAYTMVTVKGESELQSALIGLGYTADEAKGAAHDIDASLPLSDQIKRALAILAK